MGNIEIVFLNKRKGFPNHTAKVLAIDVEHHGIIERKKEIKLTPSEEYYMDDDDVEYYDELEESIPIERVSMSNTFFLVASPKTGKFEWIDEEECALLDSTKGMRTLARHKSNKITKLKKLKCKS